MRQKITDRTLTRKDEGEIWDELLRGFGLRIGKTKKTFFVMTRIDGKQRRITVGNAALMTLGSARDEARGILRNAARGIDPQEAERVEKREAQLARRDTFASVSESYMLEHGRHLKSGVELQRKLDRLILPVIGHIPVGDITRADIKDLFLRKAEDTPVAANRMLALINVIMSYACDEELVQANVAARIKPRPETPRDRYLDKAEIKSFWTGLDNDPFDPQLARILKLLLVTGQRRVEVGHMKWSELDLANRIWTLPSDRTKAKRAHRIPLTDLAIDLIGQPNGSEYVFSSYGSPYNLSSIGQALYRNQQAIGMADNPVTPHDLRRTMATHLGGLDIDRLIIGKLLNHAEQGVTGQVYDLARYDDKKRIAMEAWSNKLMEIVSGKAAPSNVARLKRA